MMFNAEMVVPGGEVEYIPFSTNRMANCQLVCLNVVRSYS